MQSVPGLYQLIEHFFQEKAMMTRRTFGLGAVGAALGSVGLSRLSRGAAQARATETYEVTFSDSEWKRRLTPEQYRILRGRGTEFAGTSPLNAEKRKGTFTCAGCDQPLFRSETKLESHRVAELLPTHRRCRWHFSGPCFVHDAD